MIANRLSGDSNLAPRFAWKFYLFFRMTDRIDFYVITLPEKRFQPHVLLFHGDLWTLQFDRIGCTEFDILIDVYFQDYLGISERANCIRLKHSLVSPKSKAATDRQVAHTQQIQQFLHAHGVGDRYISNGPFVSPDMDQPPRRLPSARFMQFLERHYNVPSFVLFFLGAMYDSRSLLAVWGVTRDVCLEVFRFFGHLLDAPMSFEEQLL
jgi:hypothetical protein